LLASANATIPASIAQGHGGDYGLDLAVVAGMVAIAIVVVTALGKEEAKGVVFGHPRRAG
jgi:SHS family lactate transporter-like MFS transporter